MFTHRTTKLLFLRAGVCENEENLEPRWENPRYAIWLVCKREMTRGEEKLVSPQNMGLSHFQPPLSHLTTPTCWAQNILYSQAGFCMPTWKCSGSTTSMRHSHRVHLPCPRLKSTGVCVMLLSCGWSTERTKDLLLQPVKGEHGLAQVSEATCVGPQDMTPGSCFPRHHSV